MRALVLLLALAVAAPVAAQQVRTAVLPDAITVGDVFHAVIRVEDVGDARPAFPDSLLVADPLENAGHRRITIDTVRGGVRWTAWYPLTGWRPGEHRLEPAVVQLAVPGAATARAEFPGFSIRSVLPADTAGVQPQPPRDVLGADRLWWPILLAILVLLAALVALWWWRRRRRPRPVLTPVLPMLSPREAALAALARARESGALELGHTKAFYSDVSEALRGFVAAVDAQLGTDLTTSELEPRLVNRPTEEARELLALLRAADLVKFARRQPTQETALEDWERARRFVERFDAAEPAELQAA